MKNFKNTRWLITGGTSGLGLALAKTLTERGARVAIVARDERRLEKIAREFPVIPIAADVSRKQDIYRIAGQALNQLGGLDYLVNNASSLGHEPLRLLVDSDCEALEQALQTNLVGPFRLTKALLPSLLLQGHGTVVNITSDAAVNAYPRWGIYSATKAALAHLSRVWNEEHSAQGISFVAIDPGDMDTPLHAAAVPDADRATLKSPAQAAREILEQLPRVSPKGVNYELAVVHR